jgi:hypothetical protein
MPTNTQRSFLTDARDNPDCLSLILDCFGVYIL